MEKYKDRKEQRQVTETMCKLLLPLLDHLDTNTAINVRRALYLLSKIDIESQESEDEECR